MVFCCRRNGRSLKLIFVAAVFALLAPAALSAADWTLAAQKFTFTQSDTRSSAQQGAASLLPQLILEQIINGSTRIPTNREMLNRTLDDLLTKRLSLFLQLSKEVKTRDSLVITEQDERSRAKKSAAEDKKIADLQKQIKDNLDQVEKAKAESQKAIDREESTIPDAPKVAANGTDPFNFTALFEKKESVFVPPSTENIVLYKKSSESLFAPSDSVIEAGVKSREFEKAITGEKINGLVVGSITIYGEYAAITTELLLYPGAVSAGVITEVGSLSDCVQIATNIARYLSPKLFNSLPIDLYFDIQPSEAVPHARITVDGFVYSSVPDKAVVQSGIHTVEIESEGYNTQTVSWNFKDVPSFLVHANLTPKTDGVLTLSLRRPLIGTLYANGAKSGDVGVGKIDAPVHINGQPVIGQLLTTEHSVKKVKKEVTDENGKKKTVTQEEEGPLIGSFFYIPEELSVPGENLMVKMNPVDNAAVIDRRRIWMYRGYSALIVTLPLAFFCYGNYNALYNGYSAGIITDTAKIKSWNTASLASIGVSVTAGAFFIFELVRYLKAADQVIPATVQRANEKTLEASLEASSQLVEPEPTVEPDETPAEQTTSETNEAVPATESPAVDTTNTASASGER